MDTTLSNIDIKPTSFSPRERRLYELLGRKDQKLASKLEGIVRVLADSGNPDRFAQAANSIRGIADKLLERLENTKFEEKETEKIKQLQTSTISVPVIAGNLLPVRAETK